MFRRRRPPPGRCGCCWQRRLSRQLRKQQWWRRRLRCSSAAPRQFATPASDAPPPHPGPPPPPLRPRRHPQPPSARPPRRHHSQPRRRLCGQDLRRSAQADALAAAVAAGSPLPQPVNREGHAIARAQHRISLAAKRDECKLRVTPTLCVPIVMRVLYRYTYVTSLAAAPTRGVRWCEFVGGGRGWDVVVHGRNGLLHPAQQNMLLVGCGLICWWVVGRFARLAQHLGGAQRAQEALQHSARRAVAQPRLAGRAGACVGGGAPPPEEPLAHAQDM